MEFPECLHLQEEELMAVLKLGGVKKLFIFPTDDTDIWNPCCRLTAEGLMTQIDGQFRLRRDLYDVVRPISQAGKVVVLTPLDPPGTQVLFYLADKITMLTKPLFGGFSLCTLEYENFAETVMELLSVRYYEGPVSVEQLNLPQTVYPEATREQLEDNAAFLLEKLQGEDGSTEQWIRGIQNHFVPWLEWRCGNKIRRETMTQEHLRACVQQLADKEAEQ